MRWTVLSGVAAWLAAAGLLAACADGTSPANEQRVAMAPISFNEIAGWADDKHAEALASFRRSCPKLTAGPDTKIATDGGFKTITQAEWKKVCDSAGAVKAERGAFRRLRERVLELVAVVEDLRLAREDRLERRLGDAGEPLQGVANLHLLLRELRLVGEILEPAAAAGGEVGARRVHPLGPRLQHLGRERLGVVALDLRDARPDAIARQAAAHEDDEAVEPRDTVATERERLDVELELVALGDGRGHD